MNSSQLLYKISNLRYTIRRQEEEYRKAISAGEPLAIESNGNALSILKADLHALLLEFNASPVTDYSNDSKTAKRERWWQRLFNFKTANTKS